jgi:hypothetical protein
MRNTFILIFLVCSNLAFPQAQYVNGIVRDAHTGESLIGANILYGEGKGTVTDFEGKFRIQLEPGNYSLQVSYVGYETQVKNITVSDRPLMLEIRLVSIGMR